MLCVLSFGLLIVFVMANSDIFEDNSMRIAVNIEVFQEFIKYKYFVAIRAAKKGRKSMSLLCRKKKTLDKGDT